MLRDWDKLRDFNQHAELSDIKKIFKSRNLFIIIDNIRRAKQEDHSEIIKLWCKMVIREGFTPFLKEIWKVFVDYIDFTRYIYAMLTALERPELLTGLSIYHSSQYCISYTNSVHCRYRLKLYKQGFEGLLEIKDDTISFPGMVHNYHHYISYFNAKSLMYCLKNHKYGVIRYILSLDCPRDEVKNVLNRFLKKYHISYNVLSLFQEYIDFTDEFIKKCIKREELLIVKFLHHRNMLTSQLFQNMEIKNTPFFHFLALHKYIPPFPEPLQYRIIHI